MVMPSVEQLRALWEAGHARRLGMRVAVVEPGFAEIMIERPYGDERDHDPLFLQAGLHYAVDIAALAAVLVKLDPATEQPNGTASLHLNTLHEPTGSLCVRARVTYWSAYEALIELTADDASGRIVAQGLSGYSLRPRDDGAAS